MVAKRAGLGILVLALLASLYWTMQYPRDRTPGFYLFGGAGDESVEDWSFANDVELCALQVYAGARRRLPAGTRLRGFLPAPTTVWAISTSSGRAR